MSESPLQVPKADPLTGDSTTHRCAECGTELSATRLSCPSCHRLVHAERLSSLARDAAEAQSAGELVAARDLWRSALGLLPPESTQERTVRERVEALSAELERAGVRPDAATPTQRAEAELSQRTAAPTSHGRIGLKASLATLGSIGLFFWKFKFALTFVLTKGKLLLLGLTKGSTVFSMALSMGVYWAAFGWWFAAGLIASIYVHEMGHVAALHRLGIRASAPMFIPGFGAMVRLHEYPAGPREDSRVGLAGPLYGLATVVAFYCAYLLTDIPHLAAIARVGAWLNLFNLLPVWQLDGSRGLRSLSKWQRWATVGAMLVMWFATEETLLVVIGAVAAFRVLTSEAPEEGDARGFTDFLILVVGLGAFCALNVPHV